MENKEISRRETLNLAKFGLLLAAGLGVVEHAGAEDSQASSRMLKTEIGSLFIKLYKYDGTNYSLMKTMALPAVQLKQVLGDKTSQITIKFWRPSTGAVYGSLSDTMQKI